MELWDLGLLIIYNEGRFEILKGALKRKVIAWSAIAPACCNTSSQLNPFNLMKKIILNGKREKPCVECSYGQGF